MSTPVPGTRPRSPQTPSGRAGGGPAPRVLADRYRVGRRIGAGGMATIVAGVDEQMDRPVAIKVLHAHLADDPEVRARFAAEARHAASLSHPHVVTVYDQGEADLPYIVLELVGGPSLREVLATHGPLSPAQVLAVVEPLCSALDAAHRIGLIHRDIKPENVLMTPEGTPKLADFGIARVMAATSHTATGTLVGSVHYLAPELVDGIEATPASDQYALSVLAFELLTGRKPLPADTPMAIALRHANEDIPPPSRYAPEVSPALDAVIARGTARAAADRYPDLVSLAGDLRRAVDAEPAPVTHLTDDGVLHTLVMPSEQVPTTRLTGAVGRRPAPAARATATGPPPSARRWGRRIAVLLLVLGGLALVGGGGYLAWTEVLNPATVLADLGGMTRAEAFATLEQDGLRADISGEEHRLDVPAGVVIGQDPPPGTELREGAVVDLRLSLGPAVVAMPELLARSYEEVSPLLEANFFDVVVDEAHHDTVPAGAVIAQLPDPGSPVEQGSQVAVTVSLGIEQVEVPAVEGLDVEAARQALADVRLEPQVTSEWSDAVPTAGIVIGQSVAAGDTVDALSVVGLVVSRGPLTVEVPDLRGSSIAEARAVVEALEEIELRETTGPVPTLGPFTFGTAGRVERQVPDPGTPIRRGEVIEVFYFVDG